MEREEADFKYKWNLKDIYKEESDWEEDLNKLEEEMKKISSFKGKLGNLDNLLEFEKLSTMIDELSSKLYVYSFLSHDVDLNNPLYTKQLSRLNTIFVKEGELSAFALPELASYSDDYIKSVIADNRFIDYKQSYEQLLESREHILSEKEEIAINTSSSYSGGFSDIYDTLTDVDLKFPSFEVDGVTYKMSQELYGFYLGNKNREVRKKAWESLYSVFNQFSHTYAKLYEYHLKARVSQLKLRKYKTYLSRSLQGARIPEEVYLKLVENVDNNVEVMKSYFTLIKEQLKIDDFMFYDTYVSISSLDKSYTVEEQFEILKKALLPLGEDYVSHLQEAFDNHWFDFYPSDNKSSGGYQYGHYSTHPFIFLNDTGDYRSMSTTAHEFGHAMHSYYSDHNQSYSLSHYSIYVAEVASTVNEILLNRYMMQNATSIDDKIFFLDNYIKNIKATVMRQVMFSEFEKRAHDLVEADTPLDLETLNKEYHAVLEKHFKGVVNIDEYLDLEWIRISHFYRDYYVYKYATSYITANYIATSILENKDNMKEKYRELLKSGGSDWPNQLLIDKVGVDLSKDYPYELLFNDLRKAIEELKELLKEKENKRVAQD